MVMGMAAMEVQVVQLILTRFKDGIFGWFSDYFLIISRNCVFTIPPFKISILW